MLQTHSHKEVLQFSRAPESKHCLTGVFCPSKSGTFDVAINFSIAGQKPFWTRYFVITIRQHGNCECRRKETRFRHLTRFQDGSSGRLETFCRAADGEAWLAAADTLGLPQAIADRPPAVAVLPLQTLIGLVDSIATAFLIDASILQRVHALAEEVAKNRLQPFPRSRGL